MNTETLFNAMVGIARAELGLPEPAAPAADPDEERHCVQCDACFPSMNSTASTRTCAAIACRRASIAACASITGP